MRRAACQFQKFSATLSKTADVPMIVIVVALISIGFVMVASASISYAEVNYGDPWFFIRRHALFLTLSALTGVIMALLPIELWRQYGWLALIFSIFLLILVLIPGVGKKVNGSQRWLMLGPISIQASEIVKFCTIVFFADYLDRRQQELRQNWQAIAKPLGVMGLLVFLLLLEPDFGSSVVLSLAIIAMLFLAGVKLWQFVLLSVLGVGSFAMIAILSPYRLQRLVTFLDPWADQFNSGYQLTQSLIAFGRGEWFGVGLGNSVQKLFYLPEAHTDFIFSIIAEELGLIGCLGVMTLFVLLTVRIYRLSQQAMEKGDHFTGFAAFGIGTLLAAQTLINIGVASGVLPTKGLTLPFISYGGSSLLVSCAMVFFLLRLHWELHTDNHSAEKATNKQGGRHEKLSSC